LITWAEGANFGIVFEFSAVRTSVVTLRLEYDTLIFSVSEALGMIERINTALEEPSQSNASSTTIGDLGERLLHVHSTAHDRSRVRRIEFGTRLAALV
jgi:hypothetical protein